MQNSVKFPSKLLDNVIALKLLTMLCTPFTEMSAYKVGVIDEKGKYLIPKGKRTPKQEKSVNYLVRLIINIKKLINKLPGGENKLKNIIAAMVLIKEQVAANNQDVVLTEANISDYVSTLAPSDERYKNIIAMWCEYLKLREEIGTSGILGGDYSNSAEIANTTSNISIPSFPITRRPIVRRKRVVNN